MATDNPLLGGSDDSFNDWASETTQKDMKKLLEGKLKSYDAKKIEDLLKKIVENTKALKGKGSGGSGSASGIDFTKAVKAMDLKGGAGGSSKPTSSSSNGATQSVLNDAISRGAGVTPGGAGGGGGPIGSRLTETKDEEIEATKKSSGGMWNFAKTLSASTIELLSFSAIMGSFGSYVSNSIDGYRELIGVGHDFNGSMLTMRKSAADAEMGFDSFVKVMSKHSETIKKVGTGEFISLQKNVRKVGREFGQFGLTVEGTSDFLADYLETTVRLGNREKLDETTRTMGFQNYMIQLSSLSKATGIQREELAKAAKGMADNENIRMAMNNMSKEDRAQFSKTMTAIGPKMEAYGKGMASLISDAIGSSIAYGNIGMSDLGKVAAIAGADTAAAMESLSKIIEDGGEDANVALAELAKLMRSDEFVNAVGKMELAPYSAGKAVSAGAQKWMHATDELAAKTNNAVIMTEEQALVKAKQQAAEAKGTQALLNVQSDMGTAFGKMQEAILVGLTPAIKGAGGIFASMLDSISGAFTPEIMKSISDALLGLFNGLSGFVTSFSDWVSAGGLKETINDLTKWISEIDFKTIFDGIKTFTTKTIPKVIKAFNFIVDNIGTIISVLIGFKVATVVGSFMAGISKMSSVLSSTTGSGGIFSKLIGLANPMTAAVAAVAGGAAMIGKDVLDIGKSIAKDEKIKNEDAGGVLGGLGGAGIGAVIGSFILPGIGTAIGAGLGGMIGNYFGDEIGSSMDKAALTNKQSTDPIKNVASFNIEQGKQIRQQKQIDAVVESGSIDNDNVEKYLKSIIINDAIYNKDISEILKDVAKKLDEAQIARVEQIKLMKKYPSNFGIR